MGNGSSTKFITNHRAGQSSKRHKEDATLNHLERFNDYRMLAYVRMSQDDYPPLIPNNKQASFFVPMSQDERPSLILDNKEALLLETKSCLYQAAVLAFNGNMELCNAFAVLHKPSATYAGIKVF